MWKMVGSIPDPDPIDPFHLPPANFFQFYLPALNISMIAPPYISMIAPYKQQTRFNYWRCNVNFVQKNRKIGVGVDVMLRII